MNLNFKIEMILASVALLIIIVFCLKRNSIALKYSIMWMLLPIVFILIVLLSEPMTQLSLWLGFGSLSDLIFVVLFGLLIIFSFALTIVVSKQQKQITKLIQDLSILKKKQDDRKK